MTDLTPGERAELSSQRWREEQAQPDPFGPMDSGPPKPVKRRRGRNRTKSGSAGAPPKAPVVRKFGAVAPVLGEDGEPLPIPERPQAPRITVPRQIGFTPGHAMVLAGTITAVVLDMAPSFEQGEVVPLVRFTRAGERDEPLMVEVLGVEHVRACDLSSDQLRQTGYAPAAFANVRYPKVPGGPQMRVRALQRDESPVWFASFTPSTIIGAAPILLDDEQGRVGVGVHNPRWLAPAGAAQRSDAHGYADSEEGGMLDAGVCIEPELQARYTKLAQPTIAEGAVKGSEKTEQAKVVGNRVHRAVDPTRGAEGGRRRRAPRPATLDRRREEATPDEIRSFMGLVALPDGEPLRLEPWQEAEVARAFSRADDGTFKYEPAQLRRAA